VAEGASSGGGVDAGGAVEVWGDAECGVGVCGGRGGVRGLVRFNLMNFGSG
jgi:hypothetical protein